MGTSTVSNTGTATATGAAAPSVIPHSAIQNPHSDALLARLSPVPLGEPGADLPAEIMVFPAGTHTIHARQNGRPVTRTVVIDAATAATMHAALLAHSAGPQKPYFDFDHDDTRASAWPRAFHWEPGAAGKPAGVYAAVEWTASGSAAVLGKDYRSFSPAFHVDNATPARVTAAPLNMGGLVNSPAFRAQSPIWAKGNAELKTPAPQSAFDDAGVIPRSAFQNPHSKHSPATSPHNPQPEDTTTMTEEEKRAAAAAKAQADAAKAEADHAAALQARQAETDALKAKLAAFEKADADRRKADAKARVDAAIARGALPPKDEALQAKWRGLIEADPAHAALLDALPGTSITRTITKSGAAGATVVIAKDGLVESLRAMRAAAGSDRHAIYAKDVRDAFADLRDPLGPILAAHDLGTLAPELIVQRAFARLKDSFPWLRSITTDFSAENAQFGQTIKTRLLGALAAHDYDPATGYGANDASATDVPIVINKHKGVPLTYNVNELASTTRDLFGEQTEAMHIAIATAFITDLLALVTAANFTKVTTATLAAFARATLTAMAREQNKDKVPSIGRILLLNPDAFEKLGADATIVQLAAYQKPELITQYTLPPVAGYQPYEVVSLPTAANLAGLALTRDALALATRVPNDYTQALPGASNGAVSVVTNPDTGISVQLVQYVNHDLATSTARVATMYGVAVGNPAVARRLTLTAA